MYTCRTCGNEEAFIIMKVTQIYQEEQSDGKIETSEDITEVVVCGKCKGGDIEDTTKF